MKIKVKEKKLFMKIWFDDKQMFDAVRNGFEALGGAKKVVITLTPKQENWILNNEEL